MTNRQRKDGGDPVHSHDSAQTAITIIGGGSVHWMPPLLTDIALEPTLSRARITLHDIDEQNLALTTPLAERIFQGTGITVTGTTDRTAALRGADFVIVVVGVGGLDAMEHDLEIPARFGIAQSVGDTTGPGGLSRALRTIPVLVDIAREMERECPDAWLINLTNPMTTLCRAVTRATSIKTIGMCHELVGALAFVEELFGVDDPAEIEYSVAGVNHLTWIVSLSVRGEDGFELLRRHIREHGTENPVSTPTHFAGNYPQRHRLKLELFNVFGALPAVNDRHTAEFFPFFLSERAERGARYEVELTSIRDRRIRLANWQTDAREIAAGERPVERVKSKESVSDVIASLATGVDEVHMLNLPNRGQVSQLPVGTVVETLASVGRQGARGITTDPIPDGVLAALMPHVLAQELTVDAALAGDRDLALQALLTEPLTVATFTDGRELLDQLIDANAAHLPQFTANR